VKRRSRKPYEREVAAAWKWIRAKGWMPGRFMAFREVMKIAKPQSGQSVQAASCGSGTREVQPFSASVEPQACQF
jgi:hypothetical protein